MRLVLPMGPRKQHLPPSRSYPIVGVGLGCVPLLDGHGRALPHAQRPRPQRRELMVPRFAASPPRTTVRSPKGSPTTVSARHPFNITF